MTYLHKTYEVITALPYVALYGLATLAVFGAVLYILGQVKMAGRQREK